jgi:excisionase family DNA binding protein
MPSDQQLLTAKEAATLLCLSENTIRQWIWQRRLPVVRLGRAVRLKRHDLEQLINQNCQEAMTWSNHV